MTSRAPRLAPVTRDTSTNEPHRRSVFDRLGPMPPVEDDGGPKHDKNKPKGSNNRQRQQGRGAKSSGNQKSSRAPPPNADTSHRQGDRPNNAKDAILNKENPSTSVQVSIKPNALLYRSLKEVKKDIVQNDKDALIDDLKGQLDLAQKEKFAAEELANALLLSQQTLLQDKTRLQTENDELKRKIEQLQERLEFFLHNAPTSNGAFSPRDVGGYEAHGDYDLPITPDSAMMKALREARFESGGHIGGLPADGAVPNFSERLAQEFEEEEPL